MSAHVVDANVINMYQSERIANISGHATKAIDCVTTGHYIVLDVTDLCRQEWLDCAAGKFPLALEDWIADMMISQKIKLANFCDNSMHKELCTIGLPKRDHKWVRLAIGAETELLVTNDIDFFDPSKKKSDHATLNEIKLGCLGPVAKYLRKEHDVRVMCPENVPSFLTAA